MAETLVGSFSGGRGRKRKRQVSWAAAELLEEVKVFHVAKPVNPSVPPPAVDDGDGNDDPAAASDQPGLALLGLLGVKASTPSSNTPDSFATPSLNGASTFQHSVTAAEAGQDGSKGGAHEVSMEGGGGAPFGEGMLTGSGRGSGGSRLFKGFETTETVVRRKKAPLLPLASPPETPQLSVVIPTPGGVAHGMQNRYPKDIWPGHKPPSHKSDGSSKDTPHGEGDGDEGKGGIDSELLEFFCDGCDETILNGVQRMECAVCPDEFCLCEACYDEGELLDKRHEHELLPSSAPYHVTSAPPNAEAAAAAAKALHVTEAQDGGKVDGGYDDDDLE